MRFFRFLSFMVFVSLVVSTLRCSKGKTGSVTTQTTITSSTLTSSALTILNARDSSNHASSALSSQGLNQIAHKCPSGAVTCFTPTSFTGKFSTLNLRVTPGNNNYIRLPVIEPEQNDVATRTFDLSLSEAINANFKCCEGKSWKTNEGSYTDLLWTVGIIDVTFSGTTLGFSGTYSLRFVFANDAALGYVRGDILIKDGTDYKWCPKNTTVLSACSTTRPDAPITQDEAVVNYAPKAGDPKLPYLNAELYPDATGKGKFAVSSDDLIDSSLTLTVDFDLEKILAVDGVEKTFGNIFEAMPEIFVRGFSAAPAKASGGGGVAAVLSVTTH